MAISKIPPQGLEDVGVADGTHGTASQVPVVTVNPQGQVTTITTTLVDDPNKLPLAGGTVTGTVAGTTFKSDRTTEDARNTGFQIANGTDIGECNRSTQYYDDLASNCNGYLPTGNCLGNSTWTPPNGNWWTWGASGVPTGNCANYGSYNAAVQQTLYAVSVGYNYDAYYEYSNEIGGSEQHRWYRNCNCGSFNCRTNCNCNCNCTNY